MFSCEGNISRLSNNLCNSSIGCKFPENSIKIHSIFQVSHSPRKGILIRFASSVLTVRELRNASLGEKEESVQP